jgi:outer membrane protein
MRHFLKVTLLAIILSAGSSTFAQTLKFGHIDSNKLLSIMPEREVAQKQLQAAAAEYDVQNKAMSEEYKTLVNAYLEKRETLSEAVRTIKETEIQELQNRMQTFDGYAQQEIQKKQSELMKPIFDKASNAIKAVGAENGFIYVFDISTGVILFNSNNSVDIMPLVKTKLGIL